MQYYVLYIEYLYAGINAQLHTVNNNNLKKILNLYAFL